MYTRPAADLETSTVLSHARSIHPPTLITAVHASSIVRSLETSRWPRVATNDASSRPGVAPGAGRGCGRQSRTITPLRGAPQSSSSDISSSSSSSASAAACPNFSTYSAHRERRLTHTNRGRRAQQAGRGRRARRGGAGCASDLRFVALRVAHRQSGRLRSSASVRAWMSRTEGRGPRGDAISGGAAAPPR